MNKFRRSFSLVSLLMVVLLLTGCIQIGKGKEEFKLTFTVTLEEGGEGKVDDVTLKVGEKVVPVEDGKAEATVAKGEVTISATLDGYKAYEEKVNVTKNEPIAIHLELVKEEEEVTEEDLVEAVQEAAEGDDEEAFLDALLALQDAGLVTGVVEEYAHLYLAQAQDYDAFTAQSIAPFMRSAKEIQENVIDPVNDKVASYFEAINGAKTSAQYKEAVENALEFLDDWGLIEDYDQGDLVVYLELAEEYPANSIAALQNILDAVVAAEAVAGLFEQEVDLGDVEDLKDLKVTDLADFEQDDLDEVAELVDALGIADIKATLGAFVDRAQELLNEKVLASAKEKVAGLFGLSVTDLEALEDTTELELKDGVGKTEFKDASDELKKYQGTKDVAYLSALIAHAEELWLVAQGNELEDSALSAFIVNELGVAEFKALLTAQRTEVADRLVEARNVDGYKPYEKSADFIAAVKAEVNKYLGQIDAVNTAADKDAMVTALKAINTEYAELEDGLDAQYPVAEKMIDYVKTTNFTPFKTIEEIYAMAATFDAEGSGTWVLASGV